METLRYAVRHVLTKRFMPTFRRGGYSIWNPNDPSYTKSMEINDLRIFNTAHAARCAIISWKRGRSNFIFDDSGFIAGETSRTPRNEELEIVELFIRYK